MKHATAILLAVSLATPMAMTATPAASWKVLTKWWDANKDKQFWKAARTADCWKEGASMTIYKSGNKVCDY